MVTARLLESKAADVKATDPRKDEISPNYDTFYDLNECKAFQHALIYDFEPETCLGFYEKANVQMELQYYDSKIGQHKDIFNAYMYAQNNFLPELKKTGLEHLKPEQLIQGLHNAHKQIACTHALCNT